MILKSQYYFANISAMKAWIFKKFETLAHKGKMNYYKNFHEKFHKDPSFNWRDICKLILTCFNHSFPMSCTGEYYSTKFSLYNYFCQNSIGVSKITLLLKDPVDE